MKKAFVALIAIVALITVGAFAAPAIQPVGPANHMLIAFDFGTGETIFAIDNLTENQSMRAMDLWCHAYSTSTSETASDTARDMTIANYDPSLRLRHEANVRLMNAHAKNEAWRLQMQRTRAVKTRNSALRT